MTPQHGVVQAHIERLNASPVLAILGTLYRYPVDFQPIKGWTDSTARTSDLAPLQQRRAAAANKLANQTMQRQSSRKVRKNGRLVWQHPDPGVQARVQA